MARSLISLRPNPRSDGTCRRAAQPPQRAAAATEAGSVGLPLAVQVAARPWREHEALAAMRTIEAAMIRPH